MEKPECHFGYTREQVKRIMGDHMNAFEHWARGSTMPICVGGNGCRVAHGDVTYSVDLENFLLGYKLLD